MRLVVSKPGGSETIVDEVPRGGIGSQLKVYSYDEIEEGGGLRGGLGMGSRASVPTTTAVMEMFAQKETPGGKEKKHWSEDIDEAETSHKPKKKGKRRARVASE